MDKPPTKYSGEYEEQKFFDKIKKFAQKAGLQVIYAALVLFYLMEDPKAPAKAKLIVVSALGYFVFPFDIIPDMLPGIGFADDLGAMYLALSQVIAYLQPEHKQKAYNKLTTWFKNFTQDDLREVNERI